MSLGVILTIVFVVLELLNVIDWAWWQIMLPIFIELALFAIVFVVNASLFNAIVRRF